MGIARECIVDAGMVGEGVGVSNGIGKCIAVAGVAVEASGVDGREVDR